MKNGRIHSVSAVLPLMGIWALSACQSFYFPEEEYSEVSEHKLTVLTRSANSEFSYPVRVYGFNEEGVCIDAQTLDSADKSLALKLPSGKHKIVAVSASVCNNLPNKPSLHDVITMPAKNYLDEPFSMGQADVTMGESSQNVTVIMSHRVAQLEMVLKQVPEAVSAVQVTVSKAYTQLSLEGKEDTPKPVVINCTKHGSEWRTGTVYLLPTESRTVTFSVSCTADKVQTYGYVMNGVLEANAPYTFTGIYTDGIQFSFTEEEWLENRVLEFAFGPGSEEMQPEQQPADDSVTVEAIPTVGSIWNGHVVADVEVVDDKANLLLLSLMEWTKLTSAYYESDPDVAKRLAQSYSEDKMGGWRIPTSDEAKRLRAHFMGNVQPLNEALEQAKGQPVVENENNSTSARYLCEEATFSFSFASGSNISSAGKSKKAYRLRLVRTVQVKLK